MRIGTLLLNLINGVFEFWNSLSFKRVFEWFENSDCSDSSISCLDNSFEAGLSMIDMPTCPGGPDPLCI